jgi:1-acyl-sn-glycerol-3-phosphate acyltransferase
MAPRIKPLLKTISYVFAKGLFSSLFFPYFRVQVKGGRNLPKRGGFLLAANHFSYADPLILGCFLRRRLWFVMAEDQFEKPIVHTFSRLMDVVPMKTGTAFQLGGVKKVLTLLKQGRGVAIFPEGQRSKTGGMLPPQSGVGVFATRARVPVVPTAIAGTREAYPPGTALPRPRKVRLFVGEPMTFGDGVSAQEIADRVMEAVALLLKENGYADYV